MFTLSENLSIFTTPTTETIYLKTTALSASTHPSSSTMGGKQLVEIAPEAGINNGINTLVTTITIPKYNQVTEFNQFLRQKTTSNVNLNSSNRVMKSIYNKLTLGKSNTAELQKANVGK